MLAYPSCYPIALGAMCSRGIVPHPVPREWALGAGSGDEIASYFLANLEAFHIWR